MSKELNLSEFGSESILSEMEKLSVFGGAGKGDGDNYGYNVGCNSGCTTHEDDGCGSTYVDC